MATHPAPHVIEAELAELEEACASAAREMSTSRTVRETLTLADVTVPHHLQAIARGKVHSLTRHAARTRHARGRDGEKSAGRIEP